MKKITLLCFTLLAFQFGNAQQTISFESSEGYALGEINGQNGWISTPLTGGGNVVNQTVANDFATDGTFSLKIDIDPGVAPSTTGPVVGARYPYATAIPYNNSVFSFDVNISEQNGDSSDYIFGLVNAGLTAYVTYIRFSFTGAILVLSRDGANAVNQPDTMADWLEATTYNVRIEIVGSVETFFIDNVQIYTGPVANAQDIGQARFIHDNYGGFAHMDNFRTNNEATAGINEFDSSIFTHSYNKDTDVLTMESSEGAFNNLQLYNLLGQEVINKKLSQTNETVSLATLQDGVYLARIMIEGQVKTIKFLKH